MPVRQNLLIFNSLAGLSLMLMGKGSPNHLELNLELKHRNIPAAGLKSPHGPDADKSGVALLKSPNRLAI